MFCLTGKCQIICSLYILKEQESTQTYWNYVKSSSVWFVLLYKYYTNIKKQILKQRWLLFLETLIIFNFLYCPSSSWLCIPTDLSNTVQIEIIFCSFIMIFVHIYYIDHWVDILFQRPLIKYWNRFSLFF